MGKISRYDVLGDEADKKRKPKQKLAAPTMKKPTEVSDKSSSNKLRDVRRALAKLEKRENTTEEDAEHVQALKQKVAQLEKRREFVAQQESRRSAQKKLETKNRKAMFLETRKTTKLLKKAQTEEEREKYRVYLEYIKLFPAIASNRAIKYPSLYITPKMGEEEEVVKMREDLLERARNSLAAKKERQEEEEAEGKESEEDDFFQDSSAEEEEEEE